MDAQRSAVVCVGSVAIEVDQTHVLPPMLLSEPPLSLQLLPGGDGCVCMVHVVTCREQRGILGSGIQGIINVRYRRQSKSHDSFGDTLPLRLTPTSEMTTYIY